MRKVEGSEGKDFKEIHELSVRMKRIFGKAKLELLLKVVEHGNRESSVYECVIEKLIAYLSEKYEVPNPCRFLPIPEYLKTLEGSENPEYTNFKMIITKNVKYSGYRALSKGKCLDYDHAVVALAALARLHAISYCYTKEKNADLEVWSQALGTSPYALGTRDTVFHLFKQHPEFHLYSHLFLEQDTDMLCSEQDMDTFGVLCHGIHFEESILFKYKNHQEEEEPTDAVFQNLGNCYYGSCIQDLLLLIFCCINQDIRRNFLLELIGNVYFDAFKSAVMSINKHIPLFDKHLFSNEVKRLAVSCGVSALEIGLDQQKQSKLEKRKSLHDQENVLATFRDVLKLTNADYT